MGNRVVKFRGKRTDNGEWVVGDLIHRKIWKSKIFAVRIYDDGFDSYEEHEVTPETVGQFTGLHDKSGVEIYEGDIVREHVNDYTPIYQNGIYMAYNMDKINDPYISTQFNVIWRNGCEVIGTIHDEEEAKRNEHSNNNNGHDMRDADYLGDFEAF